MRREKDVPASPAQPADRRGDWGPDRWRLYRLGARELGRAVRGAVARGISRLSFGTTTPSRLLFAPQDLRTADPTIANDIYAGFFAFAGRSLATGGRSPFTFEPPTPSWGEALYGFGWLRHLRAAGTPLSQANARSLVDEFIASGSAYPLRRNTEVTARRLISFISQSPLILEGADHAFYQRFLKTIGRLVRDLERELGAHAAPYDRLSAAIALCYAGLCCEGLDATSRAATRLLGRELERQILADGGHASRNPAILIELLFDLLPLRQIYASREVDTPPALLHAIDRMLPMLRLFRHGDGTLSHFNGMGVTKADHLATLLTYDDMRSQPIHHAPYSGYERLEAGRSLLVVDSGGSPPLDFSREAGGGSLSFEFSSGRQRLIVNCGMPRGQSEQVVAAARSTPAHSTASIGQSSSCRFLALQGWWYEQMLARWLLSRLGAVVLTGPHQAAADRGDRDGIQMLSARHDGFVARFGVTHERHWRLSPDGQRLEGEDLFLFDQQARASVEAVVRFHLAPGIRVSRVQGGRVVMLILPNREAWQFEVGSGTAQIEDSVFFCATEGARRTEQIVLTTPLSESTSLHWRFERLVHSPQENGAQAEPPKGLL